MGTTDAVILLLATAHFAGPTIADANLARDIRDGRPVGIRSTFAPADRRIVCVAEVRDLTKKITLTATLVAVEIERVKNRKLLNQAKELDPKTLGSHADVSFTFTLPRDWPKGKYRVDLALGKAAPKPLPFEVK